MESLSEELLIRMRIPPVHWTCTIEKIPRKCPHKEAIEKHLDNSVFNLQNAKGLLLFGMYSAGKSGLASICLKYYAIKHRKIGLWVTHSDIPGYYIDKVMYDEDQRYVDRMESVPVLVIDEFQLRPDPGYVEWVVENTVRRRIENRLVTIITTNHTPSQLLERYPALSAPLEECLLPIKIQGHNFRKALAEKKGL